MIERVARDFTDVDRPFSEVMNEHTGLPSFAGIVRARRKIQVEFPHLLPEEEIQKLRAEEEEGYRDYYRE